MGVVDLSKLTPWEAVKILGALLDHLELLVEHDPKNGYTIISHRDWQDRKHSQGKYLEEE